MSAQQKTGSCLQQFPGSAYFRSLRASARFDDHATRYMIPSTTITAKAAQMTLDCVLPIHSNTSQRALLSWKISFFMVTSKSCFTGPGSLACAVRHTARKEYGFHRTGAIEDHEGTGGHGADGGDPGSCCEVASAGVTSPTSLSAESAVPASPQGETICCTRRQSCFAPLPAITWGRNRWRSHAPRASA